MRQKTKKSREIPWYSAFPEVELNLLHLSVGWTRWLASNKQNKAEVIMSDVWDQVITSLQLSPHSLSLLDHSFCSRILKQSYRKVHVVRNWGLLPTARSELKLSAMWVYHGGSESVKTSDDHRPSPPLGFNPKRDPELEPPSLTAPEFLTCRHSEMRNTCDFKLSFVAFC